MRLRARIALNLIATSCAAATANADIVGVECTPYLDPQWESFGYDTDELITYRVYAVFDDPDDQLIALYGSADNALVIDSSNDAFVNTTPDSRFAPEDLTDVGWWENQWDSYVTIELTDAEGDGTQGSPAFVWDVDSDYWTDNNSWFAIPNHGQGFDDEGRVLFAQFTMEAGESVSGVVNLFAELADGTNAELEGIPFGCAPPPCIGDFDGDGMVGVADLLRVIANWGPCPGRNVDLNGDGWVDVQDMLELLSWWGGC